MHNEKKYMNQFTNMINMNIAYTNLQSCHRNMSLTNNPILNLHIIWREKKKQKTKNKTFIIK